MLLNYTVVAPLLSWWSAAYLLDIGQKLTSHRTYVCVEDEFNVPIALSAFRDKGSRLWSFKKRRKKEKEKKEVKFS